MTQESGVILDEILVESADHMLTVDLAELVGIVCQNYSRRIHRNHC